MLESYRLRMAAMGGYEGESRRRNAQKIMDSAWMRDPATKPVYVKWVNQGLPVVDDDDEVLYAKYNVKSYHNITGDEVSYLLEFRLDDMKERSDIKVGSYVSIPDEAGIYAWWLIVHIDDRPQFRQCSILKCLYHYKWVSHKDGKRVIHECLAVPRSQSSYNSGTWLDYVFAVPENQHIMLAPTNDDTRSIGYSTRFLIGDPLRAPQIAWKTSKIAPSLSGDITYITMTQEQYDSARDNSELMIADFYSSAVEPELPELEETPTISDLEIAYSGSPAVRAGGGYKKLSLKERVDGKLVDVTGDVEWSVDFGGLEDKLTHSVQGNIFKVKCTNDYSLIGKTFTITATSKYSSKSLIMEVTSL